MKQFIRTIFLFISIIALLNSCSMFCEKGTGDVIIRSVIVSEFDEIEIDGQADVFLEQGPIASVNIKIDSNLIEFVKVDISGMKLKIKESKCIEEVSEYEVHITTPNLAKLSVSGSVDVLAENSFKCDKLYIKTESSGELLLNLDIDDFEVVTKSSGAVKLIGSAKNFDIELEEAGSIDAFGFQAKEVDAKVSGAGTCKIDVSEKFYGDVSGSGKIYYKGNPKKVKTNVSGSGTIQAK